MNFIDIRSDLGGARIALEGLGHHCMASLTWKDLLSHYHNYCGGHEGGFPNGVGTCDLLSMQAPAYDTVNGYWGPNGRWICMRDVSDAFRQLAQEHNPSVVIVSGRKSILSESNGTSFSDLLISFAELGYESAWVKMNLASIGVPQDAIRVGIIAQRIAKSHEAVSSGNLAHRLLLNLLGLTTAQLKLGSCASLEKLVEERKPRIGLRAPANSTPFASCGVAWGDNFRSGLLPSRIDIPTEISLVSDSEVCQA